MERDRPTLTLMTQERIAAGEHRTCRPPFCFRTRNGGTLFELSADPLPLRVPWDKQPLMKRATSLFEAGILREQDYLTVKRFHLAWHRRLARWLVCQLQRFC